MRILIWALLLLVILLPFVSATGFVDPLIVSDGVGVAVNFSLENVTSVSSPILHVKSSYDSSWYNLSLSSNSTHVSATIPSSLFWQEGTYTYYVSTSGTSRFPDDSGKKVFLISNEEVFYENHAKTFLSQDQDGHFWFCSPNTLTTDSFVCFWSNMHAAEALRFAKGYELTSNNTYKDFALNLTFATYNNYSGYEDQTRLCDQSKGDYNCSSYSPGGEEYYMSGAERQGEVIKYYLEVASLLDNQSVFDLALNYALGSAEECDVWSADYDCTCTVVNSNCIDARNQGSMLLAYLKVYELTGNISYKSIAQNLESVALSQSGSAVLLEAFAKYYESFGDQTAYNKMISLAASLSDDCKSVGCTAREKSENIFAYLEVYKQTGNEQYLNLLFQKMYRPATTCDPLLADYSCDSSLEQGRLNYAYMLLFEELPQTQMLFDADYDFFPYIDDDIPISFSAQGYQENLTLFYRQAVDSWQNVSFDYWSDSVAIPSSYTYIAGIYEYYIQSHSARFPSGNGTKIAVIPAAYQPYAQRVAGFETSDAALFCDPQETNPATNDFNCEREHFQAWEVKSFIDARKTYNLSMVANRSRLSTLAQNLGTNRMDVDPVAIQSSCEYLDNDFVCEYQAPDYLDIYQVEGGIRQAMMIIEFSELYSLTKNETYGAYAYNYLISANQECDPYGGDLSCGTVVQEYLAYAYWNAYSVFGDSIWKTIAIDLTDPLLLYASQDYSEMAGLALWSGFEFTGNSSYYGNASLITSHFVDKCTSSFSCRSNILALNTLLMLEGNSQTKSSEYSYLNKAISNMQFISPIGANQYCDPALESNYSCKTPDQQGLMLSSYALGTSMMLQSGNISYTINVSADSRVSYNSNFSVTCSVNNSATVNDYDLVLISSLNILSAYAPQGTVQGSMNRVSFSTVEENGLRNATWNLSADWGGETTLRCVVETFQNSTVVIVNNLSNVFLIDSTDILFVPVNGFSNITFNLSNLVDFDLENLTINFSLQHFNGSDILYNESEIAFIQSVGVVNTTFSSVFFSYLFSQDTELVNVRLNGSVLGDYRLVLSANTSYGGAEQKILDVHVYEEDSFTYNLSAPSLISVNEIFDLFLEFNNTRNFSVSEVSVELASSPNLSFNSYGAQSETFTVLTNNSLYNSSVSALSLHNITWNVFSSLVGDYVLNISLNASEPNITFFIIHNISVLGDVYNTSTYLNPSNYDFEAGDSYTLEMNFSQTSEQNLTNVYASITAPSGVTIDSIHTNFTDSLNESWLPIIAINQTGSDFLSFVNVSDGTFLEKSNLSLNITFNLSSHNMSFGYSDAILKFLINGTALYTVNQTNETDSQTICTFQHNASNIRTKTCIVPINESFSDTLLNFVVESTETSSIDLVHLEIISSRSQASGSIVNATKLLFSSLSPNTTVFTTWQFTLDSDSDKDISILVESDQGATTSHSMSFTGPVSDDSGSSSSGGGGFGGTKSEIEYAYDSYDFCAELKPYEKLHVLSNYVAECELNTTDGIKNLTNDYISCVNVTRSFINGSTSLDWSLACDINYSSVFLFENISKSIYNSTKYFEIQSSASLRIIEKDPQLLFSSSFVFPIVYYQEGSYNKLDIFNRPVFFFIPLNYSSNVTDDNLTNSTPDSLNTSLENSLASDNSSASENSSSTDTLSHPPKKFFKLSSKTLFNSLPEFYKSNSRSFSFFLLVVVVLVLSYLAKKHDWLRFVSRSAPSSHRRKPELQSISIFTHFGFIWVRLLFSFKRLFGDSDYSFFLESSLEEYDFIHDKSPRALMVDIFFLFKEINFSANYSADKGLISKLRLARISLNKLLNTVDKSINRKEFSNLFIFISWKLSEGHKYFSISQTPKNIHHQALILFNDIQHILSSYSLQRSSHNLNERHASVDSLASEGFVGSSSTRLSIFLLKLKSYFSNKKSSSLKALVVDFYVNLRMVASQLEKRDIKKAYTYYILAGKQKDRLEVLLTTHTSNKYKEFRFSYSHKLKKLYTQLGLRLNAHHTKK